MNPVQLRLYSPDKKFISLIDGYTRLTALRKVNSAGMLMIEIPPELDLPFENDSILVLEQGQPLKMFGETLYFCKKFDYSNEAFNIEAYDANFLLKSRLVAYPAETSFSEKKLPADDLIKQLVRENLGQLVTDNRRRVTMSVDADLALAPVVETKASWKVLLNALADVAKTSAEKGTPVYFDLAANHELDLFFRVYIGQRGVDRSLHGSQRPLVLSEAHGLANVKLSIDHTNVATALYAAGSGKGASRAVELVIDEEALKQGGPYGWREGFHSEWHADNAEILRDKGLSALQAAKPVIKFSAEVVETAGLQYGVHYNFGDKLTAEGYGHQFDCIVDEVELSVNDGVADVSVKLSNA